MQLYVYIYIYLRIYIYIYIFDTYIYIHQYNGIVVTCCKYIIVNRALYMYICVYIYTYTSIIWSSPLPESKEKHLGALQSGCCDCEGGVPGADMAECLTS